MQSFKSYIIEGRGGSLYHSMKSQYAIQAIEKNRLLGTVGQRMSRDGRILPDPDFKHGNIARIQYRKKEELPLKVKNDFDRWKKSDWYLGISLTRSKKFATEWNSVIFELDYAKLSNNYKIVPWNWGSSKNKYKKEREEFVILDIVSGKNIVKLQIEPNDVKNPSIKNLNRYLTGIYISPIAWEVFTGSGTKSHKDYDFIINHPLFKGISRK